MQHYATRAELLDLQKTDSEPHFFEDQVSEVASHSSFERRIHPPMLDSCLAFHEAWAEKSTPRRKAQAATAATELNLMKNVAYEETGNYFGKEGNMASTKYFALLFAIP